MSTEKEQLLQKLKDNSIFKAYLGLLTSPTVSELEINDQAIIFNALVRVPSHTLVLKRNMRAGSNLDRCIEHLLTKSNLNSPEFLYILSHNYGFIFGLENILEMLTTYANKNGIQVDKVITNATAGNDDDIDLIDMEDEIFIDYVKNTPGLLQGIVRQLDNFEQVGRFLNTYYSSLGDPAIVMQSILDMKFAKMDTHGSINELLGKLTILDDESKRSLKQIFESKYSLTKTGEIDLPSKHYDDVSSSDEDNESDYSVPSSFESSSEEEESGSSSSCEKESTEDDDYGDNRKRKQKDKEIKVSSRSRKSKRHEEDNHKLKQKDKEIKASSSSSRNKKSKCKQKDKKIKVSSSSSSSSRKSKRHKEDDDD